MNSEKKEGLSNKIKMIKNIIIYILALIGLISIVWFIGYRFGSNWEFFKKGKNSNLEIHTQTTQLGFKDMGELVTQSAYTTIVVDNKDNKKWMFDKLKVPFSDRRLLFTYNVKVDAAVDFTQITLQNYESSIIVKLPHSKIFNTSLNNDSLKIYLQDGDFKFEETNEAQKALKQQATADAIANGILELADENAQFLIERMIKSNSNLKDCEIKFKYIDNKNQEVSNENKE